MIFKQFLFHNVYCRISQEVIQGRIQEGVGSYRTEQARTVEVSSHAKSVDTLTQHTSLCKS